MEPSSSSDRLRKLGIELPQPAAPVGSYTQAKVHRGLVYVTGQLSFVDGEILHPGRLGDEVSTEQGVEAARVAALNSVAAAAGAVGGVDQLAGVVQAVGYMACDPSYRDLSQVMNGASDVLVDVFGDGGVHTRSTVGVGVLPLRSPVEIQVVFALRALDESKGDS